MCLWCIWPYGFTLACIVINGNLIITSSVINKNTAWPGQRVKLPGPAVSISSILLRHHTVPTINKQTHLELMCQTSLSARLLSSSVNRGLCMIKILCFTDWSAYKKIRNILIEIHRRQNAFPLFLPVKWYSHITLKEFEEYFKNKHTVIGFLSFLMFIPFTGNRSDQVFPGF